MAQSTESGSKAAELGHRRAKGIAKLMGLDKLSDKSNEVVWKGERSVIKSGSPGTTSVGIPPVMFGKLDSVLTAFEDKHGDIQIVRVEMSKSRPYFYDGNQKVPLKMLKRSDAEKLGKPIARFKAVDVDAAGQAL